MPIKRYILFYFAAIAITLFVSCEGENNSITAGDEKVVIPNSAEESIDVQTKPTQPATGHFMLKAPKQMELGKTDDVEAWITKDSIRDAVFFKENLSPNDSVIIEQIRVGEVMEVNLIEENELEQNFSIKALSTPQQIVDDFDAVRWKWAVRPLKEGVHKLIVIARIKMMTEDLKLIGYKDLPVIDQAITVKVAATPAVESSKKQYYWLLLIPIIGLFIWFFVRKKKKSDAAAIPQDAFQDFEKEIQAFIKKDRIKEAFKSFDAFIAQYPNETLENAVVLLKSNYSNNESRVNKNLIDTDEYNINRSKIIHELLTMIDHLEP